MEGEVMKVWYIHVQNQSPVLCNQEIKQSLKNYINKTSESESVFVASGYMTAFEVTQR